MSRQSTSGSVFFFILIGVALFAAVSYAVMDGLRLSAGGNATPATEEKMTLALSELRNVVLESRMAIQMMVSEGYSPEQVSAYAIGPEGSYYPVTNSLCSVARCKLYDPNGGGLKFFLFSKLYPQFSAYPNVVLLTNTVKPQGLFWTWWAYKGTTKADIIYRVEVTKDFCNFINKKIGVTTDINSTPASAIGTSYGLSGGFSSLPASHYYSFAGQGEVAHLFGKDDGCYRNSSAPSQYIYMAYVYGR